MQGDQQVGGVARRRRPGPGFAPSRPARGSAASAPRCASCRCWPRRRPARRCRPAARARSVQPSDHDGMRRRRSRWPLTRVASPATRSPTRCATAARRRWRYAFDSDDWTRAAARRPEPDRLGARPPRLVRRVLDPARAASRPAPTGFVDAARPPRIAGPGRDLRLGPAGARRPLDARRCPAAPSWPRRLAAQLDACLDAIPRDARRRRRALLPSPRAVPRGHARRGVRLVARDAGPAGACRASRRCRPARRARRCGSHGGELVLGREPAAPGFSFDNELPGCAVRLAPFEIDAAPVTQRRVPALRRGRRLRERRASGPAPPAPGARSSDVDHPQRWRRAGDGALADALVRPLAAARPRRAGGPRQRLGGRGVLPLGRSAACRAPPSGNARPATRASAGAAASGNGPPTRSSPYPGFAAGPYADYSRPWFGDHRELRGGSFATAGATASSGVPQLLHPGAQRRLRRLPHRRPSTLTPEPRHVDPSHSRRRRRARPAARRPVFGLGAAARRAARLGHSRRSADRAAAQVQAARRLPEEGDRARRPVHPGDRLRRRRSKAWRRTSSTSPGSAASPTCRRSCAPTAARCRSCSAPRTRSSPAASSSRPRAPRRRSPT